MKYLTPAESKKVVSSWIDLLESFVAGRMDPRTYRDHARDPEQTPGIWPDNSPFYPILAQLSHDANEFVPSDDVRDETDMSPEELRIRASFALDTLKVTLFYFVHIGMM